MPVHHVQVETGHIPEELSEGQRLALQQIEEGAMAAASGLRDVLLLNLLLSLLLLPIGKVVEPVGRKEVVVGVIGNGVIARGRTASILNVEEGGGADEQRPGLQVETELQWSPPLLPPLPEIAGGVGGPPARWSAAERHQKDLPVSPAKGVADALPFDLVAVVLLLLGLGLLLLLLLIIIIFLGVGFDVRVRRRRVDEPHELGEGIVVVVWNVVFGWGQLAIVHAAAMSRCLADEQLACDWRVLVLPVDVNMPLLDFILHVHCVAVVLRRQYECTPVPGRSGKTSRSASHVSKGAKKAAASI